MEQTMSLRGNVGTRVRQLERRQRERPLSYEQRQERGRRLRWELWLTAAERLLTAVAPEQLHAVAERLRHWVDNPGPVGGRWPGLATWAYYLESGRGFLPARLPVELIDVYLRDERAQPDHDYEDCGLLIPIRPRVIDDRSFVHCVFRGAAEKEICYFPRCPHCGGATAQGAYWAKHRRAVEESPPGR
jgi:hypothetical protein